METKYSYQLIEMQSIYPRNGNWKCVNVTTLNPAHIQYDLLHVYNQYMCGIFRNMVQRTWICYIVYMYTLSQFFSILPYVCHCIRHIAVYARLLLIVEDTETLNITYCCITIYWEDGHSVPAHNVSHAVFYWTRSLAPAT